MECLQGTRQRDDSGKVKGYIQKGCHNDLHL